MDLSEQPVSGAAQRRRQRRLRSRLRHERMTVAWPWQRERTTSHEDRQLPGLGCGRRVELHGHDSGPLHTPAGALQPLRRRAWRGRGRTGSLPCPRRRSGICGAPCSRLSTQSLCCLFSTNLRRRWWNSCQTCCLSQKPSPPRIRRTRCRTHISRTIQEMASFFKHFVVGHV